MPMLRAAMALRQDELRHEFKRDMERVGVTHTHMQFTSSATTPVTHSCKQPDTR